MAVSAFARAKSMNRRTAFNYLHTYKGIDFLEECYEAEHCLSLDTAVSDLTAVCRNNGGEIE